MSKFFKGFTYAFRGLFVMVLSERNARFHLVACLTVVALGFLFSIEQIEWIAILICIGAVFGMEALNSSIEKLCDFVHLDEHEKIKDVKDLAAGGVLAVSIASAIVGLIIFTPHFRNFLEL